MKFHLSIHLAIAASLCLFSGYQSVGAEDDPFAALDEDFGVKEGEKEGNIDEQLEAADAMRVRGMTSSIVSALDSLSSKVFRAKALIPEQEENIAQLRDKLEKLRARRDAFMAEYALGLFCSGCGQSKSEILAKREQFPHENQHIKRPSAQEVTDKRKELQRPIDMLENELQKAWRELEANQAIVSEGLEQLVYGIRLWCTASTFEENLIGEKAVNSIKEGRVSKNKIDEGLAAAGVLDRLMDPSAAATRDKWKLEEASLKLKQAADRKQCRASLDSVEKFRADCQAKIADFLTRGEMPLAVSTSSDFKFAITGESDIALGVPFLMGKLKATGCDESPLKSVAQFVTDFRRSGFYASSGEQWRNWMRE